MSQRMTPAQIKKQIEAGNARKAELLEIKAKGADWTESLQEELDNLTMALIDLQEELEAKKPETEQPKVEQPKVEQPKGLVTKMIKVLIVKGHRFDPNSGKELSKPYAQQFTFGEWQNFEKYHKSLGYRIVKVLYDPYGVAKADEVK